MQNATLPIPDYDALTHSNRLFQQIRRHIAAQGPLSFSDYMQLALYAPGLGYYVSGSHKLGAEGDFVTAPEISSLFSQTFAQFYQQEFNNAQDQTVLEIGAGSGVLARDFLLQCEKNNGLPKHYCILELSPDLKERQFQLLKTHCPHLLSRVSWLTQLPNTPFNGFIIANEVMDAIPFDCFYLSEEGLKERKVDIHNGQLCWIEATPSSHYEHLLQELVSRHQLTAPYFSEINTQLPAWIQTLARCLQTGKILLIDYGFLSDEYYHPQRNQGTLMCHYRHRNHNDPFFYPGLQDITAHVDFSLLIDAAEKSGLRTVSYQTQANFLLKYGIEQCFLAAADKKTTHPLHLSQQLQTLLFPSEMGELFKAVIFEKSTS